MVKMVEEELKMEVREDIRAANITASIMPRAPEKKLTIHSKYSTRSPSSDRDEMTLFFYHWEVW